MALTSTIPPEVIPPVEAPAAVPGDAATLVVVAPFYLTVFDSGVVGWEPITRIGTTGPASSVDQVVTVAEGLGVALERR